MSAPFAMGPVDYQGGAPDWYRCQHCGAHGVKLWRDYQTFLDHQSLWCADCADKSQRVPALGRKPDWKSEWQIGRGDQIGWRIPAVPTEDGSTFWGYSSVPDAGCAWWDRLPPEKPARAMEGGAL